MTGPENRNPVPVPPVMPRVELDPGTAVTLETEGEPFETINSETVSRLFAIGVMVPERERSAKSGSRSRLALNGPARFWLGAIDIGLTRGMMAIRRGLEAAVDAGLRDLQGEPAPTVEPPRDDALRLGVSPVPDDEAERPQVVVTEEELAASFDDLLDLAIAGTDVIITRDGLRVAVMVGWGWYARQRERLARVSAAHWAAWRTGRFDTAAYGAEVAGLRGGHSESAPPEAPAAANELDDDAD